MLANRTGAQGEAPGGSGAITNEEKDLLIAHLADAGEIDPEGDVEARFLDWYLVREGVVSGEVNYEALLQAARARKCSFEQGRHPDPSR